MTVNLSARRMSDVPPHVEVGRERRRLASDLTGQLAAVVNKEQTMVPGMTERERRAADAQRLEWLNDAVLGPTLRSTSSSRTQRSLPASIDRHSLATTLGLLHRARQFQFGLFSPRLERATRCVLA